MRIEVIFALLLCSCTSGTSLPTLDRLKGLTAPEVEERLGKPDASPSSSHLVYVVEENTQATPGLPNGCALHITLRDGVVIDAIGVESERLCREFIRSKGM